MEYRNSIKSIDYMNDKIDDIFSDYLDIDELQNIQNLFSEATGVASLITKPDGTPITSPSGFCGLCKEIRKTEKGFIHCKESDSIIGKSNDKGPTIHKCYSGGLMDAGASIIIEGKHVGNWLIGQIIDEDHPLTDLDSYADEIGLEKELYKKELSKVKRMTKSQFESISNFLYHNAQMISRFAMKNIELSRELNEKKQHEAEIKKLNEELREKSKEINKFFDVSSDLFSITDAKGAFYRYNKAWENILGYSEDDLIRMNYRDCIHPDDFKECYQVMKQIEEKGKTVGFITRFRHKDGSYRYLESNCIKEGKYYYSADRDITKRMEIEIALAESERSKAMLISNLPGIVYRCKNDENWTMTFISEGCYELTGYKAEELLGNYKKSYNEIIDPNYRGVLKQIWDEELSNRTVSQVEYPIITAAGNIKWVWEQSRGVCDQRGNVIASEGYITDVTERKTAQDALVLSDRLLKRAQAIAHIGNWNLNLATLDVWASEEAFKIYGIEKKSDYLPLIEIRKLVIEEDRNMLDQALQSMIYQNNTYDVEYSIIRPNDGERRILNSQAILELDSDGKPVKISGILQDITQRKIDQEELLYYSYRDQLTGVYNRRFYEEEVKKLDIKENLPMSIIVGDVNGLKQFNDAFGHQQGDLLLKKVAEIIKSMCSKNDVICRWGGDKFIVLLPSKGIEESCDVASRIRARCANEIINGTHISISLGWDVKSDSEKGIGTTMRNAEDQMYKHKIVESEGLRGSTIKTVIHTLHEKSPREERHSKRVSDISQSIGRALGLSEFEINQLRAVGLLHDIGKIGISESILDKIEPLSPNEYEAIKKHPEIGYRILNSAAYMKELAEIILSHHERWDGNGYPNGLKGDEIPILARIVSVADSYDAMMSDRPYRKALTEQEAISQIIQNSGTQFDVEIAKIFIKTVMPVFNERELTYIN